MNNIKYDPETGIFTWAVDSGRWGRIKAGTPAGHTRKDGYVILCINGKHVYAHVYVFELEGGIPAGYEVDHIDRNPSNNKRTNLRLVTSSQNKYNIAKPITNSSGIKGVHWNSPTNSYRARFRYEGKFVHVGMFNTLEEAYEAVKKKRKELHGEFYCE